MSVHLFAVRVKEVRKLHMKSEKYRYWKKNSLTEKSYLDSALKTVDLAVVRETPLN